MYITLHISRVGRVVYNLSTLFTVSLLNKDHVLSAKFGTTRTLYCLPTLQNNETVPQVIEKGCKPVLLVKFYELCISF